MRNKIAFLGSLFILVSALASAAPYATVTYAEGVSFTLIRNTVSSVWKVSDSKVFGMEIKPGDIISTSGSTFLELSILPLKATVQVAENTSYKVIAEGSGEKSSGELYYGRVRAKVAKLSGTSSFRIASPSLTAGVRGTDFGCDVIAPRGKDGPVLNRVFCFEGSVAVTETTASGVPAPVLIGGNEMVEKSVAVNAGGAQTIGLTKAPLSEEVRSFWSEHPVSVSPQASEPEVVAAAPLSRYVDGYLVTDRLWPTGADPKVSARNLTIPGVAVIGLVCVGSALCVGSAAYAQSTGSSFSQSPLYMAGGVMVGAGSLLGLVSSLFR